MFAHPAVRRAESGSAVVSTPNARCPASPSQGRCRLNSSRKAVTKTTPVPVVVEMSRDNSSAAASDHVSDAAMAPLMMAALTLVVGVPDPRGARRGTLTDRCRCHLRNAPRDHGRARDRSRPAVPPRHRGQRQRQPLGGDRGDCPTPRQSGWVGELEVAEGGGCLAERLDCGPVVLGAGRRGPSQPAGPGDDARHAPPHTNPSHVCPTLRPEGGTAP